MFATKSCTKCGGDMYLGQEPDGYAICCLQCGNRHYLAKKADHRLAANLFRTLNSMRRNYPSLDGEKKEEMELINV